MVEESAALLDGGDSFNNLEIPISRIVLREEQEVVRSIQVLGYINTR